MAKIIARLFAPNFAVSRAEHNASGNSSVCDAAGKSRAEDMLDWLEAQGETGRRISVTEDGLFSIL